MNVASPLLYYKAGRGTVLVVQITQACIYPTPRTRLSLVQLNFMQKSYKGKKSDHPFLISQAIHADNVPPPSEHSFHMEILRPSICKTTSLPSYPTTCSRPSIVCHLCPKLDRCCLDPVSRRLNHPERTYMASALLRFVVHKSNLLRV